MTNNSLEEHIQALTSTGQFKVLRRVPEQFPVQESTAPRFKAAIIDLETTGLDPRAHEIIEIGTLIAEFTQESGFVQVTFTDNQLQEPKTPISEEITAITGITNEDVQGQAIDWQLLAAQLQDVDLIICHNANFDRNFMELQAPGHFSKLIQSKAFGCSAYDIPWRQFGFEGSKLEYLNLKLGYFYEGHRALVDCWATFNLFIQFPEALNALKHAVKQKSYLICAIQAPFEKKDLLKGRGYRWSDGSGNLPKAWWTTVSEETHDAELQYLQSEVYNGRQINLPTKTITAHCRYSLRAQQFDSAACLA